MLVTTGAVTKRVDRLLEQGHVERRGSEHDGRGRPVRLTASGSDLVDRMIEVHLANLDRLLSALDADERTALGELLGILALSLEE